MSLVVSSLGDIIALQRTLNYAAAGDLFLHLFTNDYSPQKTDTVSSYTEASDSSYSAVDLTGTNWSIATTSGTTTGSYPATTFTFAGTSVVYGYFLTDSAGITLFGAEAFPSALTIPSGGGTITISLNIVAN